jgi:hypothetical protein
MHDKHQMYLKSKIVQLHVIASTMYVLYDFTFASLGIKNDATPLQSQSVNVMELPQIQSDLSQNLKAKKV